MSEEIANATSPFETEDQHIQWIKSLRRSFSPVDAIDGEGNIDQEFFKPSQVIVVDARRWGAEEKELLYKGIEKYGIGKWRDIAEEFLPTWDDQTLRIKTSRLLGIQSLAKYVSWKGNKLEVEKIYQQHKELGEKIGCWKSGVLVEDDNGSVAKAMENKF